MGGYNKVNLEKKKQDGKVSNGVNNLAQDEYQ
jgi:hypothetical protein